MDVRARCLREKCFCVKPRSSAWLALAFEPFRAAACSDWPDGFLRKSEITLKRVLARFSALTNALSAFLRSVGYLWPPRVTTTVVVGIWGSVACGAAERQGAGGAGGSGARSQQRDPADLKARCLYRT